MQMESFAHLASHPPPPAEWPLASSAFHHPPVEAAPGTPALPRRIYQAGDEVFHFYCWSCSNVFGGEIAKLKLDPSYLSVPADGWQAGDTVAGASPFKASAEGICPGIFLTLWKESDSTTSLRLLEGLGSSPRHWRPLTS